MERSFFLIKRIQKTDLYVVFSDMICRYLNLNPPRFIGEKSFFFFPSFSAIPIAIGTTKISVLLILLNGTLYSYI